ncbi:MAG: hypothetical protein HGA76_09955 [Candidatus Firestonebacteria bacterium]|nr:hypothetical protein [Candidatus Firestonebacteria bacterium]
MNHHLDILRKSRKGLAALFFLAVCMLPVMALAEPSEVEDSVKLLEDLTVRWNGVWGTFNYDVLDTRQIAYPNGFMIEVEKSWQVIPGIGLSLAPSFMSIFTDKQFPVEIRPGLINTWHDITSINAVNAVIKYFYEFTDANDVFSFKLENGLGVSLMNQSEEYSLYEQNNGVGRFVDSGNLKTNTLYPFVDFGVEISVRIFDTVSVGVNYNYMPLWINTGYLTRAALMRAGMVLKSRF